MQVRDALTAANDTTVGVPDAMTAARDTDARSSRHVAMLQPTAITRACVDSYAPTRAPCICRRSLSAWRFCGLRVPLPALVRRRIRARPVCLTGTCPGWTTGRGRRNAGTRARLHGITAPRHGVLLFASALRATVRVAPVPGGIMESNADVSEWLACSRPLLGKLSTRARAPSLAGEVVARQQPTADNSISLDAASRCHLLRQHERPS